MRALFGVTIIVMATAGVPARFAIAHESSRHTRTPSGTVEMATARDIRAFSGVLERDDTRREVRVWSLGLEVGEPPVSAPIATRYGRLVVRNRTGVAVDVYVSLDDDTTPWDYVDTLPAGYKLIARLPKFAAYVAAAEEADDYDGYWSWGPTSFFLRRKFIYTLLP